MESNIKRDFLNNILVQMSGYMSQENLRILEQTIMDEMSGINMEGITTLPASYRNSVDGKNAYIIQLFINKKNLDPDTKKQYLFSVKKLILQIRFKPLTEMDGTDIQYYMNCYSKRSNHGKPLEPASINNERRNLSAFFHWMMREGFIDRNPVDAVEPIREVWKPIDYYRMDDILDMRDACKNIRERAILETLRSTGARAGELIEITRDRVDLLTGDIPIISEKSGRWRTLYLDEEARHYLKKYMEARTDNSPYLFPRARYPYGKMTTGGLRSIVKTIGKRAGIAGRVYSHKFRKTLGMTLINKEQDIGVVQAVLGHANPEVTSRYYAQYTPKTLKHIRDRVA